MPCWETIAESLYEIRNNGPFAADAGDLLVQELSEIIDKDLRVQIIDLISSSSFGNEESISTLFLRLSSNDEFQRAYGRIVAAKLLQERDA